MKLKFLFRFYHPTALRHYQIKPMGYELVVQIEPGIYYETLACQPIGEDYRSHGWHSYKIKKL